MLNAHATPKCVVQCAVGLLLKPWLRPCVASQRFLFQGVKSGKLIQGVSESISTGVWCVPGFGAGLYVALKPSQLQKEGENHGKGHFISAPNSGMRQALVLKRSEGKQT